MSTVKIKVKGQPERTIIATDYEKMGKLKGVAKIMGFKLIDVEEIEYLPDVVELQERDNANILRHGQSNNSDYA